MRLPSLLRATRVAAAAPNNSTMGGAGTGVPPDELDECPPLDELDDEEEDEELELLLELLDVEPDEPKLLEPELLLDEEDELLDEEELPELP